MKTAYKIASLQKRSLFETAMFSTEALHYVTPTPASISLRCAAPASRTAFPY